MAVRKSIRDILSPADVVITVGILRRVFRRNEDVTRFLKKIDEPHELDRLYDALGVVLGLVDGKDADEDGAIVDEDGDGIDDNKGNDVAAKIRNKK